jgi:hypothetical protein
MADNIDNVIPPVKSDVDLKPLVETVRRCHAQVARRDAPIATAAPPFNWRAHMHIHPAAKLFPPLPPNELRELADDIWKNGLRVPVVIWEPRPLELNHHGPMLLDGRNRLDALALLGLLYEDETSDCHIGLKSWTGTKWEKLPGDRIEHAAQGIGGLDPYALALSFNINRRHLNAEQKRDLIEKVVKAKPNASNLAIAKQVKADDKTVAKVRRDLEARSEIPNVETRTDTKGREQPAKKTKATAIAEPAIKAIKQYKAARTVSPDDTALFDFTAHVPDLVQRISKHDAARFVDTAVSADNLAKLGEFFADLASLKRGRPS